MIRLQGALPGRYTGAPPEELARWIGAAKAMLGDRVFILGHHYQRDEVMAWADARGDSFGLSRMAAAKHDAEFIVFCGVHFMAESADILTGDHQQVLLPDLNAGCSMADMADIDAVEEAWDALAKVTDVEQIVPITYMNSSAALKAFVGTHGGAVCTSSNARAVLNWALDPAGTGRPAGDKGLFFPDQHLGRNTGYELGYGASDMSVWNPRLVQGGLEDAEVKAATLLLWKGHCSVHQRFLPEHVDKVRAKYPGIQVIVHPECRLEVCEKADALGSTERLIKIVQDAPAGTSFAIGTEIHLVNRLAKQFAPLGKRIVTLDDTGCLCTTMYRISPGHLAWALENLVEGRVVNRIQVRDDVKYWARVALDRMLEVRA